MLCTKPEVRNTKNRSSTRMDRASATGNMHRICGDIWTIWFLKYASGQTDRQTHRHALRSVRGKSNKTSAYITTPLVWERSIISVCMHSSVAR